MNALGINMKILNRIQNERKSIEIPTVLSKEHGNLEQRQFESTRNFYQAKTLKLGEVLCENPLYNVVAILNEM